MNPTPDTQQQAILLDPAASRSGSRRDGRERNKWPLCYLGIAEILLGVLACVLGILSFGLLIGLWGGLLQLVSGILAVTARCNPTQPVFTANIVLSIIVTIAMMVMLLFSSIIAAVSYKKVLCILLAVESFAGIVIAVIHCTYSCVRDSRRRGARVRYTMVPPPQMIPIQMPNGQIVYYPAQSLVSPNMHYPNVQGNVSLTPTSTGTQPVHQAISSTPAQPQQIPITGMQPIINPMTYYPTMVTVPASQPAYYTSPPGGTAPIKINQPEQPMLAAPASSQVGLPVTSPMEQSNSGVEEAVTLGYPRLYGDGDQNRWQKS